MPLRGPLLEEIDIPQSVLHAVETESLLPISARAIDMEHRMQFIGELHSSFVAMPLRPPPTHTPAPYSLQMGSCCHSSSVVCLILLIPSLVPTGNDRTTHTPRVLATVTMDK